MRIFEQTINVHFHYIASRFAVVFLKKKRKSMDWQSFGTTVNCLGHQLTTRMLEQAVILRMGCLTFHLHHAYVTCDIFHSIHGAKRYHVHRSRAPEFHRKRKIASVCCLYFSIVTR